MKTGSRSSSTLDKSLHIRRGGRDINKIGAKPPLMERTGGWFNYRLFGGLNEPPHLRELRRLREIYLSRSHPSLAKEGNTPFNRSTKHSFNVLKPATTCVFEIQDLSNFGFPSAKRKL